VTLPTPIPSAKVANIANAQDGEEGFRDIDEILNAANSHDREALVVAASSPTDATVAAPKRGRWPVQKGQRISNHGRGGKSRFLQ